MTDGGPPIGPDGPPPEAVPDARTLPDVIGAVFTNFVPFARAHLTSPGPPSFYLVMWIVGMEGIAGAIELERIYTGAYLVDNWFYAWLRTIAVGPLAGGIRYWLVGTVFHGAVRMAGGSGEARTSRYLFLYAAVPVAVCHLIIKIVEMLVYGNEYFAGQVSPTFTAVVSGVLLGAAVFSIRLMFRGMTEIQGASRRSAALLLLGALVGMIALAAFGGAS